MNEIATSLCAGLVRTTLILSAAALLLPCVLMAARCRSAAVHRFGVCLVLLQGWMFAGVNVCVPVPGWWPSADTGIHVRTHDRQVPVPAFETASSSSPTGLTAGQTPAHPQGPIPAEAVVPADRPAGDRTQTPAALADSGVGLACWLVGGWLLGLLLVVVRWTVHYGLLVRGLPPAAVVPLDSEHLAEWQRIQLDHGITHAIPLQMLPGLGPMLLRLPRGYRLIVPADLWGELSREQRLAILRHELAHVTRRDVWTSLAVRLFALPHWFNPLAWRTVRLFDECAEWACDEAVRRSSPQQTLEYARALLYVGAAEPQSLFLSPAARGRGLSARIRRLLASNSQEDSTMKKTLLGTFVMALALCGLVRLQTVADDRSGAVRAETRDSVPRSDHTRVEETAAGEANAADAGGDVRPERLDPERQRVKPEEISIRRETRDEPYSTASFGQAASFRDAADSANAADRHAPSSRRRERLFPDGEAVIDMGHIFKNLDEFDRARDELRAEIEAAEERARRDHKAILDLQRRLENLDRNAAGFRVAQESLESELAEHKARLESLVAGAQRRFLKQETALYYSNYQRVTDEVRRYAREHGIRIVRRSDMDARRKVDPDSREAVMKLLSREVVFVDEDITADILERLKHRPKTSTTDESP